MPPPAVERPDTATRAVGLLEQLTSAVWESAARHGWFDTTELVARLCAGQLGLAPLVPPVALGPARWKDRSAGAWRSVSSLGAPARLVCEFAEQWGTDVSSISEGQCAAFLEAFGPEAAEAAGILWALDFLPRTWAALAAVGWRHGGAAGPEPSEATLWGAIDAFTRLVPFLGVLDPVTAELVRLRGARQHHCRLCESIRSRPALLAGADEQLFGALDQGGGDRFTALQEAALAFTDAMIWTPARTAESARRLEVLTDLPARVELVLVVTRNALNKIAVALGADRPHVEDGYEIYDVGPDGTVVYGLSLQPAGPGGTSP